MNSFQRGPTHCAKSEVQVVERGTSTIWAEEERPPRIPIELDHATRPWVPEQDP